MSGNTTPKTSPTLSHRQRVPGQLCRVETISNILLTSRCSGTSFLSRVDVSSPLVSFHGPKHTEHSIRLSPVPQSTAYVCHQFCRTQHTPATSSAEHSIRLSPVLQNTAYACHQFCRTQHTPVTSSAEHSIRLSPVLQNTAYACHQFCRTQHTPVTSSAEHSIRLSPVLQNTAYASHQFVENSKRLSPVLQNTAYASHQFYRTQHTPLTSSAEHSIRHSPVLQSAHLSFFSSQHHWSSGDTAETTTTTGTKTLWINTAHSPWMAMDQTVVGS